MSVAVRQGLQILGGRQSSPAVRSYLIGTDCDEGPVAPVPKDAAPAKSMEAISAIPVAVLRSHRRCHHSCPDGADTVTARCCSSSRVGGSTSRTRAITSGASIEWRRTYLLIGGHERRRLDAVRQQGGAELGQRRPDQQPAEVADLHIGRGFSAGLAVPAD
jgi:hypothetical protein